MALRKNPKRGIGFEEAQEIFEHPYYFDQRNHLPEQHRAKDTEQLLTRLSRSAPKVWLKLSQWRG
jgi:hypothetical protein